MMYERAIGRYEIQKSNWLKRVVRPDSVVVDVGANNGYFSLMAAAIVVDGSVLACEPIRENCQLLERSIEVNGFGNVLRCEQVAVSDVEAEVPMYLSRYSGLHSMCENNNFRSGATRMIRTETLDDIAVRAGIDRIDVLKIDVEGAELAVLRGAARILQQSPDCHIAVDIHPHLNVYPRDVVDFLEEIGFTCRLPNGQEVADENEFKELFAYRGTSEVYVARDGGW